MRLQKVCGKQHISNVPSKQTPLFTVAGCCVENRSTVWAAWDQIAVAPSMTVKIQLLTFFCLSTLCFSALWTETPLVLLLMIMIKKKTLTVMIQPPVVDIKVWSNRILGTVFIIKTLLVTTKCPKMDQRWNLKDVVATKACITLNVNTTAGGERAVALRRCIQNCGGSPCDCGSHRNHSGGNDAGADLIWAPWNLHLSRERQPLAVWKHLKWMALVIWSVMYLCIAGVLPTLGCNCLVWRSRQEDHHQTYFSHLNKSISD